MKIVILGGGAMGTAIAHQLSYNPTNHVSVLLRDTKVESEINTLQTNAKYFPNRKLNAKIQATTQFDVLNDADILLLTIPTKSILNEISEVTKCLNEQCLIVNMAKGIFENGQTIVEYISDHLGYRNVVTLKGASFSAEMIDRIPTLLTLGFVSRHQLDIVNKMVAGTNIFIDYTTDVRGVELLSALKNVYAILLGNIDAKFNAANTRFLVFTKAIAEIRIILKALGGKEESIFLSCGIGDISLTSLNDLSRNRTLGLLIGKGFYNSSFQENSVVLEGIKTLKLIDKVVSPELKTRLPLLSDMIEFLVRQNSRSLSLDFKDLFKKNYTTVLTYGTFDLLHFGHLEILRRAKELGDRLIVGLSTDEFNREKGKICEFSYEKRKQFLESLEYVDLVIPENEWEQKRSDVLDNDVDVFVMGDDWKGKFDFLKDICEVVYFPRTKGISTTALKSIIKKK